MDLICFQHLSGLELTISNTYRSWKWREEKNSKYFSVCVSHLVLSPLKKKCTQCCEYKGICFTGNLTLKSQAAESSGDFGSEKVNSKQQGASGTDTMLSPTSSMR